VLQQTAEAQATQKEPQDKKAQKGSTTKKKEEKEKD